MSKRAFIVIVILLLIALTPAVIEICTQLITEVCYV